MSLNKEALLQVPGGKGIPEYHLFARAMLHRLRKRSLTALDMQPRSGHAGQRHSNGLIRITSRMSIVHQRSREVYMGHLQCCAMKMCRLGNVCVSELPRPGVALNMEAKYLIG